MARLPDSCNINGGLFPWTGLLSQDKHVAVRESSNRPNFHGDKATIAQDKNEAPNHPTPQTFLKEEPLSLGMNNGIDTTEAKNNGMLKSSKETVKIVSTNATETKNTEYKFHWKKILRTAQKRYTLEHMVLLNPQKMNNPEAPQGPLNKTLNMSTQIEKQNSLSSNDRVPLRVGITNSKRMSEDQMRMLHQHLITAIIEQCPDGCGPVFLGFSLKPGWVLVTCCNQRSKDWLVNEVPYQEPWRGAQLSIIPDQELPKPPRAVTLIPDSKGLSVDEALKLLKIQNSGLNTELWKVRCEKVGKEGKTVYFTIDDPSADALRVQNCQASFGFETVTFKINGQYRVYTPRSTQNQVPATQGGSSKPLFQSLNGKSSDHDTIDEATVTNKVEPSIAAKCQLPQAAGKDHVQPIQHQYFQPPDKKIRFAPLCSLKKPAALAVGQSMSQTRGEIRPITQNSQGHGMTPLIQTNLGGPVNRESSTSARGLAPQATNRAAQQNNQESQGLGKSPLIQPSLGRPVIKESAISAKGLAPQATNRVAEQINQDSQCHGNTPLIQPSLGRPVFRESSISAKGLAPQPTNRVAQQINQDSQGHGKTPLIQPSLGRSGIRESAITAKGLVPQATNRVAEQINQDSQGHGKTPLIQPSLGRPVIRESSFSAKGLPPRAPTRAAIQDNTNTRHIMQNSQSGRTPSMGRFGSAGESVFGVDGSALANRGRSSQRVSPSYLNFDKSFQATTGGTHRAKNRSSSHLGAFALNEGVTVRELIPGGFGAQPIIQNPLSGRASFIKSREGLTESGQDGFPALARGKLSQVGDPPATLVQNEIGTATVSTQGGFSGPSQARSWFGGRPIIRVSKFGRTMSQPRSGETDRTSDQGSALTTNHVPRNQVGAQIIQNPSHGNQAFHRGRIDTKNELTVTDRDEAPSSDMSPEAGGGYHTWVIEDLESYTTRLARGKPGTGHSYATQFAQGNTLTNRQMTSVNGLSFQGGDCYGRIIGSESHGRPVCGSRTTTDRDSRPEGLLPHPSGSFEPRTYRQLDYLNRFF